MELFREQYTWAEVNALPSLTLAHIGDAVYELLARSAVLRTGAVKVGEAHARTVAMVSAEAQARASDAILPVLTEEERAVFRRGRNTRLHTVPHHAALGDYSRATALEALLGALYLLGRTERVRELWDLMEGTFHE